MSYDRLKRATLPQAVSDVATDVADLIQKELRLARAELSAKFARKLQATIWMTAAGFLAAVASLFVLQALVFGLVSYGIATHWSCLIVAGLLAVLAAALFLKGRTNAHEDLTPTRTLNQIKRDISIVKGKPT